MTAENEDPVSQTFHSSPFLQLLNAELLSRDNGRAVIGLSVDEQHLRTRGIAHGGLIATLLDTAMGAAVSTKTPDGCFAVTAQMNVHFVRPAWKGERLKIVAEVCHHGATTAVARAEVLTEKDVRVAIGSGNFSYVRDPNHGGNLEQNPNLP